MIRWTTHLTVFILYSGLLCSNIVLSQTENNDPFVGSFSGSGLSLTLSSQEGVYTGNATFQGQNLNLTAQKVNDNMIYGTYTLQGQQFLFQAQVQGNTMTLVAGGEQYILTRQTASATRQNQASAATSPAAATSEKMKLKPGEIGEPSLGFKFTPPEGWSPNQLQGGYLLGSQTQKGFVLILPHQYTSLQQLRAAAQEGLQDENGAMLQISGEVEEFGQNGVAVNLSGLVEWQKAKARAIGLLSPHGGGVTIIAAVEEQTFGPEYVHLAEKVANGMIFFKPEIPPVADEWKQKLSGARLTYMWSYYSGGSGGAYAGGSQETVIDLCPQGYFNYRDNNQMAVDGGFGAGYHGSGFGGGSDKGSGVWEVTARGQQPILRLKFHDGRVFEYAVSIQEGKTYLDDKRYFRTYNNAPVAEHRPQCW